MSALAAAEAAADAFAAENAMLDLIEHNLRTALAIGLGPQIKARLARIDDLVPAPPHATQSATAITADDRLIVASGILTLSSLAKLRRTDAARANLIALKGVLAKLLNGTSP